MFATVAKHPKPGRKIRKQQPAQGSHDPIRQLFPTLAPAKRSGPGRLTRACTVALALTLLVSFVPEVRAQQCPGNRGHSATMGFGRAFGIGTLTLDFVGTGDNCVGAAYGDAVNCSQFVEISQMQNSFLANWANATAREADSTGGCRFTCPGGSCWVRNDGLPVDLEGFGVD